MDFFTTLRVLLSRWYVVVPALALTALATAYTTQAVAPSWQATGSVVLLGPAATGEVLPGSHRPVQANPYLQFGGALDVTAEVMSKVMAGDAKVERLRAMGATAAYEVGTGSDGGSPVITIIATGDDPRRAKLTVQLVVSELNRELLRRQMAAHAPKSQFIRVEQVTAPSTAKRLIGSKLRAAAAVLALGVVLTFSLAFIAEAIQEQRARRRRRQTVAGARQPRVNRSRPVNGQGDPELAHLRATSEW